MKRVESVSAVGLRHDKRQPQNAIMAAVTLCLCLTATGAVAAGGGPPSCSVSTPGLNFGSYDVFAAGATNGNGTLSVTCTINPPPKNATVNYTISLSTGSSNSFVQRQMKSGANAFGYNLYTTNAYSIVWGDTTGSTQTISGTMQLNDKTNPSQTNTHTVYGRIPALQDVAVASDYQDNVTVTVTY
jgi:spore coat protein U-like protein